MVVWHSFVFILNVVDERFQSVNVTVGLFPLFLTAGVLRVEDVPGALLGFLPRRRLLP